MSEGATTTFELERDAIAPFAPSNCSAPLRLAYADPPYLGQEFRGRNDPTPKPERQHETQKSSDVAGVRRKRCEHRYMQQVRDASEGCKDVAQASGAGRIRAHIARTARGIM